MSEASLQSLINQQYGKLTVIGYKGNSYWECICECGNKTIVRGDHLKNLETISCGCSKNDHHAIKDISGQIFGYLKALSLNEEKTKSKTGTYWNCLCLRCGRKTTARLDWLQDGRKISCGCIISYKEEQIAKILEQNMISYKRQYVFEDLKDKRNLKFDFAVFNNEKLIYLIEYQGEQHFIPIESRGGQKELENIQRRDKMKVEYCKKNNIPLVILDKNNKPEDCIVPELINP